MNMSVEIKAIKKWFEKAKPNPTIEDVSVQIGCHYEEVAEMAAVTGDGLLMDKATQAGNEYKSKSEAYVSDLMFLEGDFDTHSRRELLDALCDQIVTAIGVAHMLEMDIEGALNEVNNSNWSKFEDGEPVFKENGKIAKGKYYFEPELINFVQVKE